MTDSSSYYICLTSRVRFSSQAPWHFKGRETLVLILKAVSCFVLENECKKQEGLPCQIFFLEMFLSYVFLLTSRRYNLFTVTWAKHQEQDLWVQQLVQQDLLRSAMGSKCSVFEQDWARCHTKLDSTSDLVWQFFRGSSRMNIVGLKRFSPYSRLKRSKGKKPHWFWWSYFIPLFFPVFPML